MIDAPLPSRHSLALLRPHRAVGGWEQVGETRVGMN